MIEITRMRQVEYLQSVPTADEDFLRYGAKAIPIAATEEEENDDDDDDKQHWGRISNGRSYSAQNYKSARSIVVPQIKTSICYIICKADDSTLVFKEKDTISPREMINLSQFFAIIPIVAAPAAAGYTAGLQISWSELIKTLGIEDFWVPGKSISYYTTSTQVAPDVLYAVLNDSV